MDKGTSYFILNSCEKNRVFIEYSFDYYSSGCMLLSAQDEDKEEDENSDEEKAKKNSNLTQLLDSSWSFNNRDI